MIVERHPSWEILDSTKITAFMTCPRMFFYEYVLGWRPADARHDLEFGEAWHKAMEHILENGYGAASRHEAMNKFLLHYRKAFSPETDDIYYPKSPGFAQLALDNYCVRYNDDFARFQVLYTEVAGAVPIDNNKEIHFRMDAILREEGRGIYALEHKTTKMTGRMWEDQWPLAIQLGTYVHALYCLYDRDEVWGAVVNGAVFLKKGPDFVRLPIRKTEDMMNEWLFTVQHWADLLEYEFQRLEHASDSGSIMECFPMNPTNCTKYRGCPYLDFCQTWANPLQHIDQPPLGYHIEWWDPRDREKEARHQIHPHIDFDSTQSHPEA